MFSYNSDDLSTSLNQVRRLIGDVNSTSAEFSDDEVNFFVDAESNIYGASAMACRSLSAKYAVAVDKAVGDLKISLSDKYEHYRKLTQDFELKALKKGAPTIYGGGTSRSDKTSRGNDSDRTPNAFVRNQNDFSGTNSLVGSSS